MSHPRLFENGKINMCNPKDELDMGKWADMNDGEIRQYILEHPNPDCNNLDYQLKVYADATTGTTNHELIEFGGTYYPLITDFKYDGSLGNSYYIGANLFHTAVNNKLYFRVKPGTAIVLDEKENEGIKVFEP